MKTDVILKRLTQRCAPDLLPWLGLPDAVVVEVTTPEFQATSRRLDNLLTLQTPDGALSLHLVEWQGYRDENCSGGCWNISARWARARICARSG